MTASARTSDRPILAAGSLLLASTGLLPFVSFSRPLAVLGLGLALLHLAWIGYTVTRLLGLRRPGPLAGASYILLGQVLALGWVYLRSSLSELLGLPGVSLLELLAIEALLGWLVLRFGSQGAGWRRPGVSDLLCYGLWLSWLAVMAFNKLDLHFTPSSDPDIHAFYTRFMLERGHLFHDLEPVSDVWMIYPSAFSSLNLILGRLSGLHPVQLVNIGAYLQLSILAGCSFSLLARPLKRPGSLVALALVHFSVLGLCLNPVFVESRMHLEGTPRLAHTALLFFPLFFTLENGIRLSRRPLLLLIPGLGMLVGMCVNPTHAPASILVMAVSLSTLVLRPGLRRRIGAVGWRRGLGAVLALAVLSMLVLVNDPFYRSLAQQRLGFWGGEVEAAEELAGSAFRTAPEPGALRTGIQEHWRQRLLPRPGGWEREGRVEEIALVLLVALGAVLLPLRRRVGLRLTMPERSLLWLAGSSFVVLAIHGLWCELAAVMVKPGILQSVLLTRYSYSLQNQMSLVVFAMAISSLLALALAQAESAGGDARLESRIAGWLPLGIVGVLIAFSIPGLTGRALRIVDEFGPKLRVSPLGEVEARDVAFVQGLSDTIPSGDRVLLPGRTRRTGIEHWIFTTDAGRALPLFTSIPSAFFLGLDGRAFTPNAYETHIRHDFDEAWLRSHGVRWLLDSGNFPTRLLRAHYELVVGNDRVNLWRLRDPG